MPHPNTPACVGERAHGHSHRSQQLIETRSQQCRDPRTTSLVAEDRRDQCDAAVPVAERTRVSTEERRRATQRRADAAMHDRAPRGFRRCVDIGHSQDERERAPAVPRVGHALAECSDEHAIEVGLRDGRGAIGDRRRFREWPGRVAAPARVPQ